jgi:hypothetical protein
MAFQTGSQINPSLGAINYTPYMQGAVAGAQSIGQGIANLGQGIASGIEQYQKQKKENKMMEAQLKGTITTLEVLNPMAARLGPEAQKTLGDLLTQLNDPNIPLTEKVARGEAAQKAFANYLNFGIQQQERATAQESESRVAQYILGKQMELQANQGLGATPEGMVAGPAYQAAPVPRLTAVEELAGQKSLMEMRQAQAGLGKTLAETKALGVSKKTGGFINQADAQNKANEMATSAGSGFAGVTEFNEETGEYTPKVVQKSQPNVVNAYDDAAAKARFAFDQNLVESANNAAKEIKTADRVISLVDSGNVNTGALSAAQQIVDKALSVFGSADAASKASATEILEALQGQAFLDQRATEKITSTMMNTANELNFYRNIFAGTKALEPESIKALQRLRKEVAQGIIDTHNRAVEEGRLDPYYDKAQGVKAAKIKITPAKLPMDNAAQSSVGGNLAELARAELERRRSSNPNQ